MIAGVRSEISEMSMTGGHGVAVYALMSDANSVWVRDLRRWAQSSTHVMAGRSLVGMWGEVGRLVPCSRVEGGSSPGGVWCCDGGPGATCRRLVGRYLRACGLEESAVLRLCPPPKRDGLWAVFWAGECVLQVPVPFMRVWPPTRRVCCASSVMIGRGRVPVVWQLGVPAWLCGGRGRGYAAICALGEYCAIRRGLVLFWVGAGGLFLPYVVLWWGSR